MGKTPFVQVSTTWDLTCAETVQQRPCMTTEMETWLSDSWLSNNSVADHRSRRPVLSLHFIKKIRFFRQAPTTPVLIHSQLAAAMCIQLAVAQLHSANVIEASQQKFSFTALTLLVGHQEEHPSCKKIEDKDWCCCHYLSRARCRLFAYGPLDATAIPKPRDLLPHLNPDWFCLSGTDLPRLSWKIGR